MRLLHAAFYFLYFLALLNSELSSTPQVAALKRELDQAHSMWESRVEGVRATLAATEQHTRTLEDEMRMRPTVQQVVLAPHLGNRHRLSCNQAFCCCVVCLLVKLLALRSDTCRF